MARPAPNLEGLDERLDASGPHLRAAFIDVAQLLDVLLLGVNETVFRVEADVHGADIRRKAFARGYGALQR